MLNPSQRVFRPLGIAALVLCALLELLDLAVAHLFPRLPRFSDNFSAAYLQREVTALSKDPPEILVLGDSVLWGYRLRPDQGVVALLGRGGLAARNLAFEGGSPANTFAMLRLLEVRGVRPALVVFNVNLKEFNSADSAYQRLHPSLETLAAPLLTSEEAADLAPPAMPVSFETKLNDAISAHWNFYALRADIREALFANVDAGHALDDAVQKLSGAKARMEAAHRPRPALFEGTYDLSTLDQQNISVKFLRRIAALLAKDKIPAVAILTPTNHGLLHEYLDVPEYRKNLDYVRALLERHGVRVIDLDHAFRPSEFIDNDHLTASGNQHLAEILEPELAR